MCACASMASNSFALTGSPWKHHCYFFQLVLYPTFIWLNLSSGHSEGERIPEPIPFTEEETSPCSSSHLLSSVCHVLMDCIFGGARLLLCLLCYTSQCICLWTLRAALWNLWIGCLWLLGWYPFSGRAQSPGSWGDRLWNLWIVWDAMCIWEGLEKGDLIVMPLPCLPLRSRLKPMAGNASWNFPKPFPLCMPQPLASNASISSPFTRVS